MLLHVQEPILYVIRKVHRQAPDRGKNVPLLFRLVVAFFFSDPSGRLLRPGGCGVSVSGHLVNHQLKTSKAIPCISASVIHIIIVQLSTMHLVSEAFAECKLLKFLPTNKI